MRGKAAGWLLFVGCLLLLSFAATTRYSRAADLTLICVRLALVVLMSVLVVRERWKHHNNPAGSGIHAESGAPPTLLQRMRRWYFDER
jgi:hypothetical protein